MTAIKTQNSILSVSTAEAAADTISGLTSASPPVVTATAHGIANDSIVSIDGVVGMVEVNNRAFVVANQATNTFELKGADSSDYTAYASGGSAVAHTMTAIGQVTGVPSLFDGTAAEIEVTHLRSTAKEYESGLQDFGNSSFELTLMTSDTGQAKLRALKASGATGTFSLTRGGDGYVTAFRAKVMSFQVTVAADNVYRATIQLKHVSEPAWFA